MAATLNGKRGLQIVLPNTLVIPRTALCKENSRPDGGVWLNPDRTDRVYNGKARG